MIRRFREKTSDLSLLACLERNSCSISENCQMSAGHFLSVVTLAKPIKVMLSARSLRNYIPAFNLCILEDQGGRMGHWGVLRGYAPGLILVTITPSPTASLTQAVFLHTLFTRVAVRVLLLPPAAACVCVCAWEGGWAGGWVALHSSVSVLEHKLRTYVRLQFQTPRIQPRGPSRCYLGSFWDLASWTLRSTWPIPPRVQVPLAQRALLPL